MFGSLGFFDLGGAGNGGSENISVTALFAESGLLLRAEDNTIISGG